MSRDALYGAALAACRDGRLRDGEALAREVLATDPDHAATHNLLGMVRQRLDGPGEALASFDLAIAAKPDFAEAHANRAGALLDLGRAEDSIASFDRALALAPTAGDWCNRGIALQSLKSFNEALASYDRAIALDAELPQAHLNRAGCLAHLGRTDEAFAGYDRALQIAPGAAHALHARGVLLRNVGKLTDALRDFDAAIAITPRSADFNISRAEALLALDHIEQALTAIDAALALNPDNHKALYTRANILSALKRFSQADDAYRAVLDQKPDHRLAYGAALWCRMNACAWGGRNVELRVPAEEHHVLTPMVAAGLADDPATQYRLIRTFADHEAAAIVNRSSPRPAAQPSERIRLGYFSADFHDHAMAYLAGELFERHNRTRFDVCAISYARDDGSSMRQRLVKAFDRFVDVRRKTDEEIRQAIQEMQIDICIDLTGFTTNSRTGVLATRPAPVQVYYLGFPGTSGAPFFDYLIADETVIPPADRHHYSENVVYLPHTYQPNLRERPFSNAPYARTDFGLPEDAFVFCCFNNSWKITAPVFDVWMRLLRAVDRSVLWLVDANAEATANLRSAAKARGIDPDRLVFAQRMPAAEHSARQRLADLFLDTLPYGAHSTASDALWVGLPVVTCIGGTFAGRVSASLLQAIGLRELVTDNLQDYEALAGRLAQDRGYLGEIKRRLRSNRDRYPLFDSERFRQDIESAYGTMMELHRQGQAPRSFKVAASRGA
jgi:protein O-GlcNAc transferase